MFIRLTGRKTTMVTMVDVTAVRNSSLHGTTGYYVFFGDFVFKMK